MPKELELGEKQRDFSSSVITKTFLAAWGILLGSQREKLYDSYSSRTGIICLCVYAQTGSRAQGTSSPKSSQGTTSVGSPLASILSGLPNTKDDSAKERSPGPGWNEAMIESCCGPSACDGPGHCDGSPVSSLLAERVIVTPDHTCP